MRRKMPDRGSETAFVTCCARTDLNSRRSLFFFTFRSRKDTRRAHSWADVHTAHVEAGS